MKTSEIAILFITGSLTLLVFVLFIVLIIIEYRKRQVRHVSEKLNLQHQFQNEVLRTKLEVQEHSFKYFSEEVHDNIAQVLSLVKLKLYKTAVKTNEEAIRLAIIDSNELLSKSLNDLRNLSHVLNGGHISKLSIVESLEKELGYVREIGDINACLSVSGDAYEIADDKKLLLFRIVQEAIGNAIRHGKANTINIEMAYAADSLEIAIADDGKGFDTKLLKESKGLGLQNMQVRAKMLGSFAVVSEPDKGTLITLSVAR